jgi:hypothetical protein
VYWALGTATSLNGALLNGSTGAVSFAVADGSVIYLFAADPSAAFITGTSFTLTANFADGTTASATTTVPIVPTISSVTPSSATPGANLTVTVTGTNFQTGATTSFGAGVTVSSTTVVSSTQLSAAIAIASSAALGARDVTVTNPGGPSAIRAGGFTVAVPPPTISLAFLGKLRDKVGASPTALAPDNALDGTFRMVVEGGSWPRTVTRLDLRRNGGGGNWDTDPVSSYWALGASTSLDSALLNAASGAVSFAAANGAAFYLFASDLSPTPFSSGSSFTLIANFADGTSASATVTLPLMPTISSVSPSSGAAGASLTVSVTGTNFQPGASASFGPDITVTSTTVVSSTQLSVAITIGAVLGGVRDVTVSNPDGQSVIRAGAFTIVAPPPTISLEFYGKLRDKVGSSPTAFTPDGALDGTFRVVVQGGIWPRTVTRVELRQTSGGGGIWDTDPNTTYWALGVATSLDGALLNAGNGTVSFAVADGGAFLVFAADPSAVFTTGTSFSLTVNLVDGSVATVQATIP